MLFKCLISSIQGLIVGFAFFTWLYSASKKKIPQGLLEWILTVSAVIIVISWLLK